MRRVSESKQPLSFGHAYAQSDTFQALFREGMTLVEETASYLDGDGRAAAKTLRRAASIVYATESMRLTTRLMQLASWLLLHRSVREGEMTHLQALEEKRKIRLEHTPTTEFGAVLGRASGGVRASGGEVALAAEAGRADRHGAVRRRGRKPRHQSGERADRGDRGSLRLPLAAPRRGRDEPRPNPYFGEERVELVLEARQAAAAVEQLLSAAGPGRMRLRVDVEVERVALGPVGGARLVFGAVRHHDLDRVIVGVNVFLHDGLACGGAAGPFPAGRALAVSWSACLVRLYSEAGLRHQGTAKHLHGAAIFAPPLPAMSQSAPPLTVPPRTAEPAGRARLRVLALLLPFLARHKGRALAALAALTAAAMATLAVPLAIRRMIDVGLGAPAGDAGFVNQIFVALVALAGDPRSRQRRPLLPRDHARRAHRRRPPPRGVRPSPRPLAGLLRRGALRRDHLAADRRHDADQVRRRRQRLDRAAQSPPVRRRHGDDDRDQPAPVGARAPGRSR